MSYFYKHLLSSLFTIFNMWFLNKNEICDQKCKISVVHDKRTIFLLKMITELVFSSYF